MEKLNSNIILAEATYRINGAIWGAIVTQLDDGVTFQLWFELGGQIVRAGQFTNKKALYKYIKDKVASRLEGTEYAIIKDTFADFLENTKGSLVPVCYANQSAVHARNCRYCPYRTECKNNTEFSNKANASIPAEDAEDEKSFLDRLQKKITATKWEGGENAVN